MLDIQFELLSLIWLHFIADFLFQTDRMALNKSKSPAWLIFHCCIYALCFSFYGAFFVVVAGVSHFMIDWITSKINVWLWLREERHWFFCMVGFDQALHITVLLLLFTRMHHVA